MLRELLTLLRYAGLVKGRAQIVEAKIPIIKCRIIIGTCKCLCRAVQLPRIGAVSFCIYLQSTCQVLL